MPSPDSWLRQDALVAAIVAVAGFCLLLFLLPLVVAALGCVLTIVLCLLSVIDLRHRLLPDVLTVPLGALGIAAAAAGYGPGWVASLVGTVLGYAMIASLALVYRNLRGIDGIGLGDAKLLAALGAWNGIALLPLTLLAAAVAGLGVYALDRRGKPFDSMHSIPFGPCLAGAGWLAFVALHCGFDLAAETGQALFPM